MRNRLLAAGLSFAMGIAGGAAHAASNVTASFTCGTFSGGPVYGDNGAVIGSEPGTTLCFLIAIEE